jgi:hypothetical protein
VPHKFVLKITKLFRPIDRFNFLSNRDLGELAFFLVIQERMAQQLLEKTNRKKRKHSDNYLNKPRCFHNGRVCVRCNRLAEYFNDRKIEISLPYQHPYGQCPLYCNNCSSKFSCDNCEATYCNHPTDQCTLQY